MTNLFDLASLISELSGLKALPLKWRVEHVSDDLADGRWDEAFWALLEAATWAREHTLSAHSWRELLVHLAMAAVHTEHWNDFEATFRDCAPKAWAADAQDTMPWGLRDVFRRTCEELAAPANGGGDQDAQPEAMSAAAHTRIALGLLAGLLTECFPRCPLGPYAAAHLAEIAWQTDTPASPGDVHDAATRFLRAAGSADQLGMAALAAHCRLRAGALLLRTGVARERGRGLLRALDLGVLNVGEVQWYAEALGHSAFWLDRVRAADALIAQATETDHPDGSAAFALFGTAENPRSIEYDRLRSLADAYFAAEEAAKLRETQDFREGIEEFLPRALSDGAKPVLKQLKELAATDDAAWPQAYHAFAALVGAWNDDEDDATEAIAVDRPRFRVAIYVAILLQSLNPGEDGAAVQSEHLVREFEQLRGVLTRDAESFAGPVALIWPKLLPRYADLRTDELDHAVTATVDAWLWRAPRPGYGWWPLAANFLAAGLVDAANAVARHAVADGQGGAADGDHDLKSRVVTHMIHDAIARKDDDATLFWLENAEI